MKITFIKLSESRKVIDFSIIHEKKTYKFIFLDEIFFVSLV